MFTIRSGFFSVCVRSPFEKLSFERDAAFAQNSLRCVVNKTERADTGVFCCDDVRGVAAWNRFRHLAADAIANAHEQNFHGLRHRLSRTLRHLQEIFVDG